MSLEEIFRSRRQIRLYDNKNFPDKSVIESLLNKTHSIVASKQNLMPYKIHVLGPECIKQKRELYELSTKSETPKGKLMQADLHNLNMFAPYVLVFTHRLAKSNPAVQRRIDRGMKFSLCDPKTYKTENTDLVCMEIGMFSTILAGLALEKKIQVSFLKCFPHWPKWQYVWKTMNDLAFVDETPYLTMQLGYKKTKGDFDKDIGEFAKEQTYDGASYNEFKPPVNDVINWI